MSNKPVALPDPATRRTTRYGDVIGFSGQHNDHAWLGIPYAQAPVGELRWRAPREPKSWPHELEATRKGTASAQLNIYEADAEGAPAYIGSEDCLYLHVWAPQFPQEKIPQGKDRLPVMVWLHGGSNMRGQGGSHKGGLLASTQSVIVVTVNYRLGVMGWFRHPALNDETATPEDRSGNFGTLDLIQALRWVQQNIAAFGGDPDNVTIFGCSAGGWNVYSLLASPKAEGLFHRAIAQGCGALSFPVASAENFTDATPPGHPESSAEILLQLLVDEGRASNRAEAKELAFSMNTADIANYLRNKPFTDIDKACSTIRARSGIPMWELPVLFEDGVVLPAQGIKAAFQEGRYNRVPVMTGSTQYEFTILLPAVPNSRFSSRDVATGALSVPDPDLYFLAARYLSEFVKVYGVDGPTSAFSKYQPGSAFAFRLDWNRLDPAPGFGNLRLGSAHGLEVVFLFGLENLGPEYIHARLVTGENLASFEKLSRAMMSYWAGFAATGNPGRGRKGELPQWQAWDPASPQGVKFIVFDDVEQTGLHMSPASLSKQAVLAQLAEDSHFATNEERVQFLAEIYRSGHLLVDLTAEDYRSYCQRWDVTPAPL